MSIQPWQARGDNKPRSRLARQSRGPRRARGRVIKANVAHNGRGSSIERRRVAEPPANFVGVARCSRLQGPPARNGPRGLDRQSLLHHSRVRSPSRCSRPRRSAAGIYIGAHQFESDPGMAWPAISTPAFLIDPTGSVILRPIGAFKQPQAFPSPHDFHGCLLRPHINAAEIFPVVATAARPACDDSLRRDQRPGGGPAVLMMQGPAESDFCHPTNSPRAGPPQEAAKLVRAGREHGLPHQRQRGRGHRPFPTTASVLGADGSHIIDYLGRTLRLRGRHPRNPSSCPP